MNRFTLWVILASATLSVAAGVILTPVLNLIRDGLNIDPASAGLIITIHAFFTAIFSPVAGHLIDKIGAKKPFIFGLALYGVAGGSGLIIQSYGLLILSRAILGIGVATIFNSVTIMLLNLYRGMERNKAMGWWQSANTFGGIIWPLIGGILGGFSWHLPFAVYLLGIPLSFLGLISIPEIQKGRHNTHKDSLEEAKDTDTGSIVKVLRANRIILVIYGIFFVTVVLSYMIMIFLPQLLGEMGISTPVHISLFIMIMAFTAGVTSLMYGRIRSHLSYTMITRITLSLWLVAFTAISQSGSIVIVAASVILCGIGQGMIVPAVMVWAGETVTSSFRGRVISYLTMFGYIGQFSSSAIFGPVVLWSGLGGVFLVGGGISLVLVVLFLVFMRE